MAKRFTHSVTFEKVGQVLDFRVHNISTADRSTYGGTLNASHAGLFVYDTDLDQAFFWDGSAWVAVAGTLSGAMVFQGGIAFNASEPASPDVGDFYIFTSAGTVTWNSQSLVVEIGDSAIWDGTDWVIIQGNVIDATTTVKGIVELADQTETNTGTDANRVVTPSTLAGYVSNFALAKTYFATGVSLVAATPFTVAHNLSLQNRNAAIVAVYDSTHNAISVDVDTVDQNNLEVTSSVALTGVSITVIGR